MLSNLSPEAAKLIPADIISLAEAARSFPGRGTRDHVALQTVHRWIGRGVRGHRLKSLLLGGRRMTRRCWVSEFVAAINAVSVPTMASESAHVAVAELERRGI